MTIDDLFTLVARAVFLLLGAFTLIAFLRNRDRARLDIALMFNSVALSFLIPVLRNAAGLQISGLSTLGTLALVAQPYLALRLAQYFRAIPHLVLRVALLSLILSWIILLATTPPLPALAVLVLVVYFAGVEGYATVAFVRGALSSQGIAHRRLLLIASASGLVAAVILLVAIGIVLPSAAGMTTALSRVGSVLAALAYYLGFAPPRSLRWAWQLSELYRFLREVTGQPAAIRAAQTLNQLCRSSTRAAGGLAAAVALWDDAAQRLVVRASDSPVLLHHTFWGSDSALGGAWRDRQPMVGQRLADFSSDSAHLARAVGADVLYAVPIASRERAWGLLLVFRWHAPLFPKDDLDVLSLLAEQGVIALENAELLAQQQTLLEAAPDAVVITNREGRLVLVNAQTERMFGYRRDELFDQPVELLIPERLRESHARHYMAYVAAPRVRTMNTDLDLVGRRKDGSEIPLEISLSPLKTEMGAYAIGIIRDITERKQAAEALDKERNLLRTLMDNLPDSVFIKDTDSRFILNNVAHRAILGLAALEEVVGKTDFDLFPKELAAQYYADEQTVIHSGQPLTNRIEPTVDRLGQPRWMLTTKVPLRDSHGQIVGIVGVCRDITERKQVEEEIRRLNADLEAANKELEAFSYSVSHDLRTPLRSVDGFSRILLNEYASQLPPEAARYLTLVRTGAQRMGTLIDDLLAFSRLGRQPLAKQTIIPTDLVRQVFADLRSEQDGRRIDLSLGDLPACQADRALLKQVFVNLVSNALKFTRQREVAHIEVGSQPVNNECVYFVRDNGAGFDMQYAHKLFGVFQRLHGVRDYEGSGVGLAIVQRIIHRHGGRVWAEGEVDKGATFYFTLGEDHD